MIEIIGFICAAIIGISLGLIGGGGSILTVPVLVYLLGVDPILATAYSLFIVGLSALIGGISYARKGLVAYKTGAVFTIPALSTVYLTRLYLVPNLPEVLFTVGAFDVHKHLGILLLFAILMVIAAISMIRRGSGEQVVNPDHTSGKSNYLLMVFAGIIVGLLAGMVGAGGGFLIIPALVIFGRLPMKKAIGTSLLIIAVNSLIGFTGDLQVGLPIDWIFLLKFAGIAGAGIFIGTFFSEKVNGQQLKKGFGWFVLAMGCLILVKELLL
ncbi:sulfite exporter TauE/SafE family protein [Marivirga atlantica]|jgi:uncharacterized membrane protein YfcA|uniref:Probable membrane transporter protein n=1 Tax=Marivirga atlantica TaxID=1548457 RepID=A0A937A784_9BACT|nr:sulfite exporter TauE/SafE family protein [Marivirga atlantica]MBL0765007.1 sulfite exporter TauE/SafE family protein [Marivirga atlantica]